MLLQCFNFLESKLSDKLLHYINNPFGFETLSRDKHKKLFLEKVMQYTINKLKDVDSLLFKKLKDFCFDVNGCLHDVHAELGPFLNEYIYQEALSILMEERNISFQKEYYFGIDFHGRKIQHKHYVDFLVKDKIYIECKAVDKLCAEHRQQLWNYMRLTKTRIGILNNFAPVHDQCEHYYLDTEKDIMYVF